MNFEEHMRTWSGYENAHLYLDPDTAKVVAEFITAVRVFAEKSYEDVAALEYALEALDAHYEKGNK